MPLYEYQCGGCGHRFEALQRIGADGNELTCPSCAAPRPEKLLSTFACGSDGASASDAFGCADGACSTPSFGGGCCGGGACAH